MATSEWFELMGRMGNTSLVTSPQDKWSDVVSSAAINAACTASFATNVNMIQMDGASFDTYSVNAQNSPTASNRYTNWIPVLELIL
ncbi:hypothetical protein D3C80_1766310 [compost metagenome]